MVERLITPSKITAWLGCGHFLSLSNQADAGILSSSQRPLGRSPNCSSKRVPSTRRTVSRTTRTLGKTIYQVPGETPTRPSQQWVARVERPMEKGFDVIYQMPFVHDGIRGIADFLMRVDEPGLLPYEPVDAKLTRSRRQAGPRAPAVLLRRRARGPDRRSPATMHLARLREHRVARVEEFLPVLATPATPTRAIARRGRDDARHAPSRASTATTASSKATARRSGARRTRSSTWPTSATPERQRSKARVFARSSSSVAAYGVGSRPARREPRAADPSGRAAGRVTRRPEAPPRLNSSSRPRTPSSVTASNYCPQPDDGDVFFDFEGHPFWTPQHDLFFLAGLLYQDDDGEWSYDERWAHDLATSTSMIKELVEFFAERRERFPRCTSTTTTTPNVLAGATDPGEPRTRVSSRRLVETGSVRGPLRRREERRSEWAPSPTD